VEEHAQPLTVTEAAKKAPVTLPFSEKAKVDTEEIEALVAKMTDLKINPIHSKLDQLLNAKAHVPEFGPGSRILPQHTQYGFTGPGYSQQDSRSGTVDLGGSVGINAVGYGNGVCNFCNNQFESPPHGFRDQCPFFHHFIDNNVCHINKYGKICIGPHREDAQPAQKKSGQSWVAAIRQKTNGTEYDENLEARKSNRPVYIIEKRPERVDSASENRSSNSLNVNII
jgi:hypothetical protein